MVTSRKPESSSALHLISFLSLVSLLIPMLLMQAQFVTVATIDTSLPALCAASCATPGRADLGLSVSMLPDGLFVQGQDPAIVEGVKLPCPGARCGGAMDYDAEGLRDLLEQVKSRHPDERSYVLSVADKVPYEALVRIFDATRGDVLSPLFPEPVVATLAAR